MWYNFEGGVYSEISYSSDMCGMCPYVLLTFPETYGLLVNLAVQLICDPLNEVDVPCGGNITLTSLEAPSPPPLPPAPPSPPPSPPSPPVVVAKKKQKKKLGTMLIVLISLLGFFVLLIPIVGGTMVYVTKKRRRAVPAPRVAFVNTANNANNRR
jgi:hypothetical protein